MIPTPTERILKRCCHSCKEEGKRPSCGCPAQDNEETTCEDCQSDECEQFGPSFEGLAEALCETCSNPDCALNTASGEVPPNFDACPFTKGAIS